MNPEGTVRGTFDLNVPAFRKLEQTRIEAERLETTLERLGRMRVAPRIEIDGIVRARAELALLREDLRRLDRMRASPGIGGLGGGAAASAFSGGGGGGGRGRSLRTVGLGPLAFAGRAAPAIVGVGLPAVQALVGATGALAGVITGASVAGGATGLAGGGALATGVGTIMAVAKPATKAVTDAYEAQTKYNDAVRQFGRESTQAVAAKYQFDQALRVAPRGADRLIRQARTFGREWRTATREAQANILSLYGGGIRTGRRALPVLGPAATRTTGALNREAGRFERGIFGARGTDVRQSIGGRFVRSSAGAFDDNLTQARRFAQFGTQSMMQLSIAARPFLLDATRFMANWSEGWAGSTSNIGRTRAYLRSMVPYVRSIRGLFGATGRLAFHTAMGGAPAGRGMVNDLTAQLNTWDQWVQRNPEKVSRFFRQTVQSTEDLAKALFAVGRELSHIATLLQPVLQRFSQLVSLAGSTGLLTPGALTLGLGAYRGARGQAGGVGLLGLGGRGGGRAPAAAGGGYGLGAAYGTYAMQRGAFGASRGQALGTAAGGLLGRGVGPKAMGALRGAGRAYLPVAALFAGLDFASAQGNVGQRLQTALSGASLGLIPAAVTSSQHQAAGAQRGQAFARGLGGTPAQDIARLRGQIARGERAAAGLGGASVGGGAAEELRASNVVLRAELSKRVAAYRTYLNQLAALRGERAASGFQRAFQVRRRAGQGAGQALTATGNDAIEQMAGMRRAGARVLAQNTLAWAREARRNNPKLANEYRDLRNRILDNFRDMGDQVAMINGRILLGSKQIWGNVRHALVNPVEKARQEVTRGFTDIQRQAIGALLGMGFSRGEASALVRNAERGGASGSAARSLLNTGGGSAGARGFGGHGQTVRRQATTRAAGGRLSGGRGLSDSIPLGGGMKGAAGELVLNRHTERAVDRDLMMSGKASLGARVRHETRRHAMPFAGPSAGGMLYGGRTAGGGGFHPELQPGIRSLASAILGRFPGLAISSTTSGGHVAGSYHYKGQAVDIAGAAALMNSASSWIRARYGRSLTEGIHNPNLSIKNGQQVPSSFWGASTWAGHANHIHLAIAGALAAGGFGRFAGRGGGGGGAAQMLGRLRSPGSRLGGVPGAMSGRAQAGYAAGLRQAINRRLGAGGGGGGRGSLGGIHAGTLSRSQIERLWIAAGGPPGLAAQMASIAFAESGFNTRAHNPSGASGLWQIMMPLHAGLVSRFGGNVYNPLTNAKVAVQLYRSAGLSPWAASRGAWGNAATGGRTPGFGGWFGQGGAGTARRPTMIGIGDRLGGEDFAVSPRRPRRPRGRGAGGSFAGGGMTLNVHFHGHVSVRSQKDIDDLSEAVAGKLLAAIRDGEGDEGMGG